MEQNHSNPLATEPVGKLLLKFSVPTALTLMVNYMYNIVDQIFVGQKAGYLGIAATNVAFPLSTICVAIALLIGDGCAANISLHLGRKEYEKANHSFANAFADCICKPAFESQRCDKTCENHEPMGDSGSVVLWNHGGTVFGCADFMVWMLSGSDHQ